MTNKKLRLGHEEHPDVHTHPASAFPADPVAEDKPVWHADINEFHEWIKHQPDDDMLAMIALSDDEFYNTVEKGSNNDGDGLPELTDAERNAIISGCQGRRIRKKDAWSPLIACLRTRNVTPDFLNFVADLIAADAFLIPQKISPTRPLDPTDTRTRVVRYKNILRRNYEFDESGKKRSESVYKLKAARLVAIEVKFDGERLSEAYNRVLKAYPRGNSVKAGGEKTNKNGSLVDAIGDFAFWAHKVAE